MIKNFYIFRNAQSSHNLAGKLQGQDNNSVLTDRGISQALSTASYLKDKNIDIVISSPQRRAKQTGSIIAKKINTPIQYDSRLREVNLGEIDGCNINKLSYKNLEILKRWTSSKASNDNISFKNGESKIELRQRVCEAFAEYTTNKYKNIAISSHNFPIIETLQSINIAKNNIEHGEIIHIQYDGNQWTHIKSV